MKKGVWDHPRSRGDHLTSGISVLRATGSPPLTRGPLICRLSDLRRRRITPAHAGTTDSVIAKFSTAADHPRSRGDHELLYGTVTEVLGSPPLTRGPPSSVYLPVGSPRITPAHAGTTVRTSWRRSSPTDHPRSRGDHSETYVSISLFQGSPPLTRGPRVPGGACHPVIGITPAHAGTTV